MILNKIEVKIFDTIELIDAYDKKFPDNFTNKNVIYCVHNKANGKNYIGQTVKFTDRFSTSYIGHFKDYIKFINGELSDRRILYRAWKKYGLESFVVYIIDICSDRESLNEKEIYWIKTLHTCTKDPECYGYNLTWGADDSSSLFSPEALEKGEKTKIEKYGHGGFINAHTPEAKLKRKNSLIKRYGVPYKPLSLDTIKKLCEISASKYNGDVMGQCNTPECRKRAITSSKLTRVFNRINEILDKSKKEINSFEDYFEQVYEQYSEAKKAKKHLQKIVDRFESLFSDLRWSSNFNAIFGDSQEKLQNELNRLLEKKK